MKENYKIEIVKENDKLSALFLRGTNVTYWDNMPVMLRKTYIEMMLRMALFFVQKWGVK